MHNPSIPQLDIPETEVAALCQRLGVKELSLFGSALRDDFNPQSDVDVLVEFESTHTLGVLLDMKDELETLFGRRVDLIVKSVAEADPNPYRRQELLGSAQVIYHAG